MGDDVSWHMSFGGGLVVVAILAGVAHAEVPTMRVEDQLFFDLHGGTAIAQARLKDAAGASAFETDRTMGGWLVGGGLAFHPSEYVSLGTTFDVMAWNAGTMQDDGTCTGGRCISGAGVQIGPSIMFGVPLRYIRPYAGIGAVMRFESFTDPGAGVDHAETGGGIGFPYIVGITGYLRRDLRVFAEYRLVTRPLTFDDSGSSASTVEWDVSTHALAIGLQFSPRMLRESPQRTKGLVAGAFFGGSAALVLVALLFEGFRSYAMSQGG